VGSILPTVIPGSRKGGTDGRRGGSLINAEHEGWTKKGYPFTSPLEVPKSARPGVRGDQIFQKIFSKVQKRHGIRGQSTRPAGKERAQTVRPAVERAKPRFSGWHEKKKGLKARKKNFPTKKNANKGGGPAIQPSWGNEMDESEEEGWLVQRFEPGRGVAKGLKVASQGRGREKGAGDSDLSEKAADFTMLGNVKKGTPELGGGGGGRVLDNPLTN